MLQSFSSPSSINATPTTGGTVLIMRPKRSDRVTHSSPSALVPTPEPDAEARACKKHHHEPAASSAPKDDDGEASEAEPRELHLLGLLIRCAEAVAIDHLADARDMLLEIYELASPFGSSPERIAAYFGDALHARVVGSVLGGAAAASCSPTLAGGLRSLTLARHKRIYQAFNSYNSLSPLVKFSHFTANQTIFQTLDGHDRVHVVDLDIMQGLQWPAFLHILASRPARFHSVRITGMGSSIELLEATGRRLSDFAQNLGLPFEYRTLEGKIGLVSDPSVLAPRHQDEVTVVHWMHHGLYDVTGSDLGTLRLLQVLRPKLITIVEQDLSRGGDFLGRFVEALHYYSAVFDAINDWTSEGKTAERHLVECQLLAAEIRNLLATAVGEVRVADWAKELNEAGFRQVSLAGSPAATQANLLLGMFPWKGYTLVEESGCLKLGWKDLSLLTASAWQPSPSAAATTAAAGEGEGAE